MPRHRRIAESLTASLASEWALRGICLFCFDSTAEVGIHYEVMQSCDENLSPSERSAWLPVKSLEKSHFEEASDFAAVTKIFAECRRDSEQIEGPFARLGWFAELHEWVRATAARNGLTLNGRFSQLNAARAFNLIRFETNGPALWFKAVGEPNLREYPITLTLSAYFPTFVPRILAIRPSCNGWLASGADGTHPDERSPVAVWSRIAEKLAELQIASIGRTPDLVDAGCHDLRISSLQDSAEPFLERMAELMERQTQTLPPPLSRKKLDVLKEQLKRSLSDLKATRIPDTLGHLDFNPSNILVSQDHCVFLDWAEAYLGHPFLTLEYLLEQVRRIGSLDASSRTQITSAYTFRWKNLFEPAEIGRSLACTPLVAVFLYAISVDAWRDPVPSYRPEVAKLLRSLCRRMAREVDRLRNEVEASVPCRN